MTWTPPASAITWQDFPNLSTAVSAAHLNQAEGYAVTVGQSVVDYLAGATTYLTPSGGDDSVAMQTALNAGGLIIMNPGTFLWNTQVPAFKRNTPTIVIAAGVDQTFIKLSATAPRAFDLNKVADYDTFTGIALSDFTVDANNVQSVSANHVVFGSLAGGAVLTKINVNNLAIRRIKTINVPTDPTDAIQRHNIYLIVRVNTADNPCSITDVVLEDLDFTHGGNIGVSIGGTTNDGSGNGNLTHDRIYVNRVRHDTGISLGGLTTVNGAGQTISTTPSTLTVASTAGFPTAKGLLQVAGVTGAVTYTGTTGTTFTGCTIASGSFSATNGGIVYSSTYGSEHIQIGSKDTGLTCTIRDSGGANSGDVGIALLNCRNGLVEGCTVVDSHNAAFQFANFNQVMPSDQKKTWRNCEAKVTTNLSPSSAGYGAAGYHMAGAPNQPIYQVVADDCKFVSTATTIGLGQAINVQNPVSRLTLRNFEATVTGISWTLPANMTPCMVYLAPSSGTPMTLEGTLRTNVGGTVALNAHTWAYRDTWFQGTSGCDITLDVQAHYSNNTLTGQTAGTTYVIDVNPAQVFGTRPLVRGSYRYVVESFTSATETAPYGAQVSRYGTVTSPDAAQQIVVDGFLIFPDCDAGRLPSGSIGREIAVDGVVTCGDQTIYGTNSGNVPLILYPRYKPATSNAAVIASGAIPAKQPSSFALSASPTQLTNQSGVPMVVWAGTGVAVTLVEIIRRSDTGFNTLGTPFSSGPWMLYPGDKIRLTYTGTGNWFRQPAWL